jgi:hypothetical protein
MVIVLFAGLLPKRIKIEPIKRTFFNGQFQMSGESLHQLLHIGLALATI